MEQKTHDLLDRYLQWLGRSRLGILVLTLLLVAPVSLGALLLEFTTDYRAFFRPDNPRLLDYNRFQDVYGKDDSVLFVLVPVEGELFTRRGLEAVDFVTQAAWQIPYVRRVDSVTNFPYSRGTEDDLIIGDLVADPQSVTDQEIAHLKRIALDDPRLRGRLVAADGQVAGVMATVELPGIEPRWEVPAVASAARALAREARLAYPGMEVHLTGISIMDDALTRIPLVDMLRLMPLVFIVIFVVMVAILRRPLPVAATFTVIFLAIGVAMGLGGWVGVLLTPPSAVAPIIILTLAVADGMHILVNYLDGIARGEDRTGALAYSLRLNLRPVTLTSLTTALGFLGLNLSASPPFVHLGNLVAIGVGAAYVLACVFLPALLLSLPAPRIHTASRGGGEVDAVPDDPPMAWLADRVVRHHRPLFWAMGGTILVLVAFIPRNELNDAFVEYFAPDVAFRRATEVMTERLTGLYLLELDLTAGGPGDIAEPSFLAAVDALTRWLREKPDVMHVASLTDILRHVNRNLHAERDDAYRLPESRELAAQYLLLYEMALPYGRDLTDQIDIGKSATRVTAALRPVSSNEMLALEGQVASYLAASDAIVDFTITGAPLVFAHVGSENIRGILLGTLLALIGISLLMILALRSLALGLSSLVPNLAPAAMAFGLWGILVGQVGMAIAAVTCMTLGIVVNDSIHFLHEYVRARRALAATPAAAVRYAFATVGKALWVTSLVLVLGFCVLLLSSFVPNAGMGLLTAITIAFALAADFLFLPPLLILIDPDRSRHGPTATSRALPGQSIPPRASR